MQALVIAHACYGHNSFFKGNYLFRQFTQADAILDYLVFARRYVMECEERYGAEVEDMLDSCHALMDYGVDRYRRPQPISPREKEARRSERAEHERRRFVGRGILRAGREQRRRASVLRLQDAEGRLREGDEGALRATPGLRRRGGKAHARSAAKRATVAYSPGLQMKAMGKSTVASAAPLVVIVSRMGERPGAPVAFACAVASPGAGGRRWRAKYAIFTMSRATSPASHSWPLDSAGSASPGRATST